MQIASATDAVKFIFAGNALFTLRSRKTGTRFTYHVRAKTDAREPIYFASVLTGPDNESDYRYAGLAKPWGVVPTQGSKIRADAPSVRALDWALRMLAAGGHDDLEVFHAGACGRCGRTLTDPVSIGRGLGPECVKHA